MSEPAIQRVTDGLEVAAFRTPTLPPATTTNTSFVGRRSVWVVDPATPYPNERTRLLEAVDTVAPPGGAVTVAGIVLTHHHPDHVGAAKWLRNERGWSIFAHPQTSALLGQGFVDVHLEEGDTLVGSTEEDDRWDVLHTPGHASGHIVLWEPKRRLMIAGDMVAATGTIVVDPPDGHMATYIEQLRRLRGLEPERLVAAHGPVIERPCDVLDYYVSHRLGREAKIFAALSADDWRGLAAVTATAYSDVPVAIHALAARAALAHLVKLEEDGAVERRGLAEVEPAALSVASAAAETVAWRSTVERLD